MAGGSPSRLGTHGLLFLVFVGATVAATVITQTSEQETTEDNAPSANTLSWQSAFWALMALALNNVAQPAGSILGMPEQWSCIYKASPVTSLVEIGFVVFELGRGFCSGDSQRGMTRGLPALKTTMVDLLNLKYPSRKVPFSHRKVSSNHRKVPSSHNVRKSGQAPTRLRVAFFILGAVPQTVKLFACSGIVLTQIIATCYLISFFYDELMMYLDTKLPRTAFGAAGWSSWSSRWDFMPPAMYVFVAIGSLPFSLKNSLASHDIAADLFSATLCFVQDMCLAIPLLVTVLSFLQEKRVCILASSSRLSFKHAIDSELLWLLGVTSMIIASVIFNFVTPLRADEQDKIVSGSVLNLVHYQIIYITEVGFQIFLLMFVEADGYEASRRTRGLFPYTELVKTIATGMIGYQYLYGIKGTYRPPWTDKFG